MSMSELHLYIVIFPFRVKRSSAAGSAVALFNLTFSHSLYRTPRPSAKTVNLFGNPLYLLARWRERREVRVVEISFHSPHPRPRSGRRPLPKRARELLFPSRWLEAALVQDQGTCFDKWGKCSQP